MERPYSGDCFSQRGPTPLAHKAKSADPPQSQEDCAVSVSESDRLLTAEEVAERLQVNPAWVHRRSQRQTRPMPYIPVGDKFKRYLWPDVVEWLNSA
jgi:hypothetical protein